MAEYRVGSHHGVTICREGDGYRCGRDGHDCERGHLVAVVVRGFDGRTPEQEAEWMCALLNAEGEGRYDPGLDPHVIHICPRCGVGYPSEIAAAWCCPRHGAVI